MALILWLRIFTGHFAISLQTIFDILMYSQDATDWRDCGIVQSRQEPPDEDCQKDSWKSALLRPGILVPIVCNPILLYNIDVEKCKSINWPFLIIKHKYSVQVPSLFFFHVFLVFYCLFSFSKKHLIAFCSDSSTTVNQICSLNFCIYKIILFY